MKTLIACLRSELSERLLLWSWRIAPKHAPDTAILKRHAMNYFTEISLHDRP